MGERGGGEGCARRPEPVGRRLVPQLGRFWRACAKILPAAELEGSLTGLIVAMPPEPVGGAEVRERETFITELGEGERERDVYNYFFDW